MRTAVRVGLWAGVVAAALIAAVLAGYYIRALSLTPLAEFIPRLERKLVKISGGPSQLEQDVATIDTTFVQLHGKVLRPPGISWTSGGALTVRGNDLVILDHSGSFYATDGDAAIRELDGISPPPNGLEAYEAFAASPDGQQYNHSSGGFRYNDVTWVNAGDLSGFALSYTFFDPEDRCYGTRVAWMAVDAGMALDDITATPADWTTIFQTHPCPPYDVGRTAIAAHLGGGRMVFQAPSTLYLASGFYGLDGLSGSYLDLQSDITSFGRVVAIDLPAGSARIVSKGHRNTQGIAIDKDGRLWVAEHGLRGGDELNLIREGGNYGWPLEGLGTLYSGQPIPDIPYGRHETYEAPVFAWLPSTAISSLAVIDGIDPAWDGDLLAGSLSSADVGRSLWHIRVRGARVVFTERIELGHRIRYVTQFDDRIAVWLDSNDLVLFEVTRPPDPLESIRRHLKSTYDADLADLAISALSECGRCHSFAENDHRAGPSLNGIIDRPVARTSFSGYSEALSSLGGRWTPERLTTFLTDTESLVTESTMPANPLSPGPVADAIVDSLIFAGPAEE